MTLLFSSPRINLHYQMYVNQALYISINSFLIVFLWNMPELQSSVGGER